MVDTRGWPGGDTPSDGHDEAEGSADAARDPDRRTTGGGHPQDVAGPVACLESSVTAAFGVDHAVAVRSGSEALRVALLAAGVGAGDDVFVSAFAPRSTLRAVVAVGARPVVVDVNPVTYTMGVLDLEAAIDDADSPAAIVPVHACGQPAEMHRIGDLARAGGLAVVEDARAAAGAAYQGRPVGTVGDAGCLALSPGATSGRQGGCGLVVTGDAAVARAARMRQVASALDTGTDGPRGRRGRCDAVAGLDRLLSLGARLDRRRRLAREYTRRLSGLDGVRLPQPRRDTDHAFSSYVVETADRDALAARLAAAGVHAAPPFPVLAHQDPDVAARLGAVRDVRLATTLAPRLLALPLTAAVDEGDLDAVRDAVAAHGEGRTHGTAGSGWAQ